MKTITISIGNQYDKDGYAVTDGTLWAYGSKDESKESGFTMNGDIFNQPEVADAIKAMLQDGIEREITIGAKRIEQSLPESKACPKCGTYCMGDCKS